MKILIKYPSRERLAQFVKILDQTWDLVEDKENTRFLVTLDFSDPQIAMYLKFLNGRAYVEKIVENSQGKIHACNRDMDKSGEWDIVLLLSDDMIPCMKGWDKVLRDEMLTHFPDLDGVLFHNDGYQKNKLNTMPICGRKYFDRFSYIYSPEYASLWADNEFMEVSRILHKEFYSDIVLFRHNHYANVKLKADRLMVHNEKFYQQDKGVYNRRKLTNFGL